MSRRRIVTYAVIAAIVVVMFLLPLVIPNPYWIHVLVVSIITCLLAVSLRALARTGVISMGTAGLMLVGAYSSALIAMKGGLSVWLAMPLGGLLSAFIAFVVGYPFLRAKGIYFAILTVMMSELLRAIAWYWSGLTRGSTGLQGIPSPEPINLGLVTLTFNSRTSFYYLALVLVIICCVILYRIEHSWLGTMWTAIRENDLLARASGINVRLHKLGIFVISAFFMGFAGAMYAHYMGSLSPYGYPGCPFSFSASVYTIMYMMVGGESYFFGPMLGTMLLTIVPEVARTLKEYMPLLFGLLLIIVVFFMPEGILGLGDRLLHRRRKTASLTCGPEAPQNAAPLPEERSVTEERTVT
ncbi:MAG: branched-chain amino acid ABC transporter permease [Thermoleophilia bacterium]|nr:branched-chain amino acid ABC transporter permease [Thermoleophilia bacterium]